MKEFCCFEKGLQVRIGEADFRVNSIIDFSSIPSGDYLASLRLKENELGIRVFPFSIVL